MIQIPRCLNVRNKRATRVQDSAFLMQSNIADGHTSTTSSHRQFIRLCEKENSFKFALRFHLFESLPILPIKYIHGLLALYTTHFNSSTPALHSGRDVWVIDQVWGQDGWILAEFFFFACLWTETESRSINTQKKNEANIKPSWPNKLGQ